MEEVTAAAVFSGDPLGEQKASSEAEIRREAEDEDTERDRVLYFFGDTSVSRKGSWSSMINCVEFFGALSNGPLVGRSTKFFLMPLRCKLSLLPLPPADDAFLTGERFSTLLFCGCSGDRDRGDRGRLARGLLSIGDLARLLL